MHTARPLKRVVSWKQLLDVVVSFCGLPWLLWGVSFCQANGHFTNRVPEMRESLPRVSFGSEGDVGH